MVVEANNNDENEDTAVNGAAGGAGDGVDAPTDATEAGVTEGTYDAPRLVKGKTQNSRILMNFKRKFLKL